jgi:hypothetical protein
VGLSGAYWLNGFLSLPSSLPPLSSSLSLPLTPLTLCPSPSLPSSEACVQGGDGMEHAAVIGCAAEHIGRMRELEGGVGVGVGRQQLAFPLQQLGHRRKHLPKAE